MFIDNVKSQFALPPPPCIKLLIFKMTRGWTFCLLEVQTLYYLCTITKGADKLHDYHEADLHLYFSKKQIFHDTAQIDLSN